MIKLLESLVLYPSQRAQIIRSVRSPEGIEMLYSRTLQNVGRLLMHESDMAAKAFRGLSIVGSR